MRHLKLSLPFGGNIFPVSEWRCRVKVSFVADVSEIVTVIFFKAVFLAGRVR
jgi:hypothetical protein